MSILVTTDIFIKRAKNKHGNKFCYSKVSYIKQDEEIILICPIHGEFLMEPRNHLRSDSGCNKCKDNLKITNEGFIRKAKAIHGDKYDYTKIDYKNKNSNLILICPIHGEFAQVARFHLKSHGCQKCGRKSIGDNKRHTVEEFIVNANKKHSGRYDYSLVDYINANTKVKIICLEHGEFEQVANKHLKGCGCPKCKESKGEKIIREFLIENDINYNSQHKFNGCRNILKLPFDFYLPDYNICIEFNGAQHYKPVKYWGGEETLKKIKFRDKIKMEYCKSNNIPLMVIRYNENVINKLLILLIKIKTKRSEF